MRAVVSLLAVLVAPLVLPGQALGHAQLLDSSPPRGAQLAEPPRQVVFRFDEPVEIGFGSVRVFDAVGEQVQAGSAEHPDGRSERIAVSLPPDLPDGNYVATYRVISADSHPVAGGFAFTVGEGGAAPRAGVAELIEAAGAGPVTEVAFGAARALAYLAIALAVGGVAFLVAVWRPAQRALGTAGPAREAFERRARQLLLAAAALGALSSALGIVLQGATAAGSSFWEALEPTVVREVVATRFGEVWGLRLLAWLALAALFAVRPAAAPRRARATALAALLGFIALTPALAGHAANQQPRALLIPADLLHVLAMSVWIGGIVFLLAALPSATRRLPAAERTRLLASAVARFSVLALAAVIGLAASGTVQSVVNLSALADLWDSAFGRAVAVKVLLFAALIALGAHNRQRSRPRLARLAAGGQSPGAAGVTLRRALRAEVALLLAALGVSAALVSYAPPGSLAGGPYSERTELGPAQLEATVDPARVGPNEIHIYLFDSRTGAQYDRPREVGIELRLPAERIGPLAPRMQRAGPGHFVATRALLVPDGEWELTVRARISEFTEHRARLEVPVR